MTLSGTYDQITSLDDICQMILGVVALLLKDGIVEAVVDDGHLHFNERASISWTVAGPLVKAIWTIFIF